ncbi:MAG: NADH-quinone oxidoreductase subunit NuoN [Rhodobacterales bacterium]|nr:NADH-quinone oxidoreductase subunit NuoN [Rhodobacterales bacterium]
MSLAQVPNLIPALPELFIVCVAMALLMFGVFQKQDPASEAQTTKLVTYLAATALVLAILWVGMVSEVRAVGFGGLFITDPYGGFFKVLVLMASAVTLYISQDYLKRQGMERFEYPVLFLFAVLGMMMMISANDLLSLYLGLEIQSLSLYVIAAFQRDSLRSNEAGLKYFVLGALASGMLLYGSSLIYGFTGATNFDALAQALGHAEHAPSLGVIFGIVFLMAGLAFKVSAVPFHMWTPDVYEGAPTPVTAFFAVAPKVAAMALFIRVMMGPFGDLIAQWQQVVVVISVLSMALGAFAAIAQTNIKRMMAYSSIGHMGYALIGLASGSEYGVRGVMIYLAIYLFMNVGVFACILAMRRGDRMVTGIGDLAGLAKTHPMMALALSLFMFSMAGVPPLAGFFGKFYVFMAAIQANLYGLAVLGVLSSVVGAFYYLRIVKVMYFDPVDETLDRPLPRELATVIGIAAVFITFFFLYPPIVLTNAAAAAASLVGG